MTKILNSQEKKQIEKNLNEEFGIKEVPGMLLSRGEERIFIFQGSLNEKQIEYLEKSVPVERIGIYFARVIGNEVRLSIEGIHILKNQITKNIFDLNDSQANSWLQGEDLQIKTPFRGFLIMKHGEDFIGCGKASENKIGNFIPKSRRLKSKSIIK